MTSTTKPGGVHPKARVGAFVGDAQGALPRLGVELTSSVVFGGGALDRTRRAQARLVSTASPSTIGFAAQGDHAKPGAR
jgi:hypothetical protein